MTEIEIFEYLKKNLYIDYDKDYFGKNITVILKLRHPDNDGTEAELGSVWIEIPDIEVGRRQSYY